MANLLDSVENSIWHAFDYLALEGDGTATKVKLKVGFLQTYHYFLNIFKITRIVLLSLNDSFFMLLILSCAI